MQAAVQQAALGALAAAAIQAVAVKHTQLQQEILTSGAASILGSAEALVMRPSASPSARPAEAVTEPLIGARVRERSSVLTVTTAFHRRARAR